MTKIDYILTRIEEGVRVRVATDYFGQHVIEVPRRWLPLTERVALKPDEMDEVRRALAQRRARRNNGASSRSEALSGA